MSSIIRTRLEIPILVALGLWGLMSSIQGAGLSLFVSGPHQYTDTTFIELVYFSVITAVLVSLISSRLASILLGIAAIICIITLYETDGFGHGSATSRSLLLAIALRPLLAALVLLALPARGPLLREFAARRAKNSNVSL
jgi:hypothetical protein